MKHHEILYGLDQIILCIFVIEVVIKTLAEGSKPSNYFKNPWNLFDFCIVAACLVEPILDVGGAFTSSASCKNSPRTAFSYSNSQITITRNMPFEKFTFNVLCEHPIVFTFLYLRNNGRIFLRG